MAISSNKLAAQTKAVAILKKLPVFHGLVDEEYQRLMAICNSTVAKKGVGIFNQGDDGSSMYILLSGEVDINVVGVGTVHIMKPGEILGEIGLVKNAPRTANAVAKSQSVLLQLYAESLRKLVRKNPMMGYVIMRNIARILADRLSESNKSSLNLGTP